MKRMPNLSVNLLIATMGLAFVCLASPAAASPCVRLGEYYTYAQQCAPLATEGGWMAVLVVASALLGGAVGMMSLRRHVLRLG